MYHEIINDHPMFCVTRIYMKYQELLKKNKCIKNDLRNLLIEMDNIECNNVNQAPKKNTFDIYE